MFRNGYWRVATGVFAPVLTIVAFLILGANPSGQSQAQTRKTSSSLLIDDFTSQDENSPLSTRWAVLLDLGRRNTPAGSMTFGEVEQRKCLHLSKPADPDRAAGVVEARLSLHPRGRNFDASAYSGIRLTVKGNGQPSAVRLRTKDTRLAGQYYQAQFRSGSQWQRIDLPFTTFTPAFVRQPLDSTGLRSVTIADGAGADLYVDDIAFYRGHDMDSKLTPEEERVILYKGTEAPFTGRYTNFFEKGVYTCKRCGAELFESSDKFKSDCGWPSFDEQIPGAVKWQPDADGIRTEIICNNCGAHLGHVFLGEGYTPRNTRYCVNSISMDFIPAEQRQAKPKTERALFASGCFWGTEYYFQRAPGVISTTVGFTGGRTENPTYKQVSTGRTGHAETTEVIFDPTKTSYEQLAKLFFETHDFTQMNRQGPDIGTQYRSAIFYLNDEQKQIAERLVEILRQKGYNVKTEITPAGKFWSAENYHQDYYNKTGGTPYCHIYRRIF
jgi:peptide methionine sulfoxide reductase msrA/msrB